MDQVKRFIVVYFLALRGLACEDIIEKDFSKVFVEIYSPPDGYVSSLQVQTFWWEEKEGAGYRFQIVAGTFSVPLYFVMDTLLKDSRFVITLNPGDYEWRVAAENSTSRSPFNTHSLRIDTTSDLTGQLILLTSPVTGSYLDTLLLSFQWQGLASATGYQVQIAAPDFSSTTNIVSDTMVTAASLTLPVPFEGVFSWRVRGMNSQTQTSFSSVRTFTADTTRPASPFLQQPANASLIFTQPFQFTWLRDQGMQGSPLAGDSIYLYSDSLVTLCKAPVFTSATILADSLPAGTYFWRVRTIDLAGNPGYYSTPFRFTVQ